MLGDRSCARVRFDLHLGGRKCGAGDNPFWMAFSGSDIKLCEVLHIEAMGPLKTIPQYFI